MRGDGKDKFYRTLNLDEDGKKALTHFKEVKQEIIKEKKNKDNEDEIQRK